MKTTLIIAHQKFISCIKTCLGAVLFISLMVACKPNGRSSENESLDPNAHKVKIKEVIHTSNYTYLLVSENGKDNWLAVNRQEVKEGGTYYYINELVMNNFRSRELNRTFETIYFVQHFTSEPIINTGTGIQATNNSSSPGSAQAVPSRKSVSVEKANGGFTIAEVFSKRLLFKGRKIKIRGEVVKFSPEIMGKNWVHIQDGTNNGDEYDLTVTTMDKVETGDILIFEGIIGLDRDFGAGYVYGVIMEDARVIGK